MPTHPIQCVKDLSVCQSVTNIGLNYLRTGMNKRCQHEASTTKHVRPVVRLMPTLNIISITPCCISKHKFKNILVKFQLSKININLQKTAYSICQPTRELAFAIPCLVTPEKVNIFYSNLEIKCWCFCYTPFVQRVRINKQFKMKTFSHWISPNKQLRMHHA